MVTIIRHWIPYHDTEYRVRLKPQSWRYYLEYAPYGDLDSLMLRYRAFNRYLPELFLWHAFDSLATAICNLEYDQPLFPGLNHDHVLHLDVKPRNIVLGYETAHNAQRIGGIQAQSHQERRGDADTDLSIPEYPSLKLADFGVSVLSSRTSPVKFKQTKAHGTLGFFPPVRGIVRGCFFQLTNLGARQTG